MKDDIEVAHAEALFINPRGIVTEIAAGPDGIHTRIVEDFEPYRAANGHMMIQTEPGRWWNSVCIDDCDACHNTSDYADEPWYDDGMI
jgi:hypothetical protein